MHVDSLGHNGRIADLGPGGMFVQSEVASRHHWLDKTIDVDLRLDGITASWLRLTARVLRVESNGLAFAFDTPSAELLAVLDDITTHSNAHRRVTSVVLIDYEAVRRARLAEAFRTIGCVVVEAATPLDAIALLGEARFEPDVIAIADSKPVAGAEEIRDFVRTSHPNAKLVTITDELLAPAGIAHWLSSANPHADLSKRIRAVLFWAPSVAY